MTCSFTHFLNENLTYRISILAEISLTRVSKINFFLVFAFFCIKQDAVFSPSDSFSIPFSPENLPAPLFFLQVLHYFISEFNFINFLFLFSTTTTCLTCLPATFRFSLKVIKLPLSVFAPFFLIAPFRESY